MKATIKFVLFLIYSICIFFIDNYMIFSLLIIIHILIMILSKINIKEAIKNLIKILPFILFTIIINVLLVNISVSLLIGIRLIIICNITYIFSKTVSPIELRIAMQNIVYPLKIFKIDSKDIGIIVSIALCFMPILKNEVQSFKNTLKAKGIKTSNINMIKNSYIMFNPFFISILQKLNEIDRALKVKGYQ